MNSGNCNYFLLLRWGGVKILECAWMRKICLENPLIIGQEIGIFPTSEHPH
jgi:hypothetical protein